MGTAVTLMDNSGMYLQVRRRCPPTITHIGEPLVALIVHVRREQICPRCDRPLTGLPHPLKMHTHAVIHIHRNNESRPSLHFYRFRSLRAIRFRPMMRFRWASFSSTVFFCRGVVVASVRVFESRAAPVRDLLPPAPGLSFRGRFLS